MKNQNPLKNTEPIREKNRTGLRDWKRYDIGTTGYIGQINYLNKSKGHLLSIQKSHNLSNELRYYLSVESEGGRGILVEKTFKTKSQALAFARNYMRTH